MTEWSKQTVAANGLQVNYHRTGAGSNKPPIVLLHGYTDNGLCWSRVARDLARTHDVIMPDARGHGQTEGPVNDMAVNLLADDVAAIIRQLGLQESYLFGHSMGGMTALAVAANHPDLVRAALLEDPPFMLHNPFVVTPADKQKFHEDAKRGLALQALPIADRIAQGKAENPNWPDDEIGPWADAKGEYNPEIINHRAAFRSYPWRTALERVQCPVLLITAEVERGAIVLPEVAQEACTINELCEMVQIKDAGHCIHRDRHAETLQVVQDFLSKNPGN